MPPKQKNPSKKREKKPAAADAGGDGKGAPPAYWGLSQSVEDEWCEMFRDAGACACLCGVKSSGKTLFALSFIRSCLEANPPLFDTYWCVIPAYQYEQKGSYGWLDELVKKKGCRCVVFSAFSDEVAERIVAEQLRDESKKSLMFMDDASCMRRLFQRSGDVRDPLNAILTQSRHLRVSSLICVHSLKATIHPSLRANCSFLVMFDISSRKLLEHLHEEFASLVCPEFDEFLAMFMHHLRSRRFGAICFSTARDKRHDVDCLDWKIIKGSRDKILAYIEGRKKGPRPAAAPSSDGEESD